MSIWEDEEDWVRARPKPETTASSEPAKASSGRGDGVMRTNDENNLMTPEQLSEELSVSQAWIRDHVSGRRKPLLPHVWLGDRRGMLRFRRSEIEAFLKCNTRNVDQRGPAMPKENIV